MKSERLKKLEVELEDLEQWLKLGLVPKKDVEKHKKEIQSIQERISEEKDRLRFLKENGEVDEYVIPKKSPARQIYPDPHTMPDMDMDPNMTDAGLDMETENFDTEGSETQVGDENTLHEEEEDDPFSDRNRWKRGIMEDPDADNW
ncbi:MAG: hypothetical protein AAGF04_04790 [Chlamydiota bacterium]